MAITNKTWAIIGGAAALVLVPAGVSYAVVAATDDPSPAVSAPAVNRAALQDQAPAARGSQFGGGPGGANGAMRGDTDRFRDGSGDRDRDRARDGSYCDGEGPIGTPPSGDARGRGPGMMDGSGRWNG